MDVLVCTVSRTVAYGVFAACVLVCVGRYAHPGDPPLRHTSHAGQRAGTVLLCLLHLRHRRCAAVGGATEKPLFHGRGCQDVSYYRSRQMSQQGMHWPRYSEALL